MELTNILYGVTVRLTAVTEGDLPIMAGWYQDAGFLRLYDADPAMPRTEKELAKILEEDRSKSNHFLFAIRPVGREDVVGRLGIEEINWSHQVGWMSIGIGDRTHWDRGYGTEAMQLALRFAFHELNLHRVQLTVFSYNERAISLYENLGFQREGIFREFLQRDGRRHDMLLYGLLRREWEACHRRESDASPARDTVS